MFLCAFLGVGEASDALTQALEDVICSMKQDEECQFEVKMDDTLAKNSLLQGITLNSVITYTVHLISFERGIDVWCLSDYDREQIVLWHKTKGTELFKTDNVYGAALHYSKALKYILSVDRGLTDHELIHTDATRIKVDLLVLLKPLHLNLAACQLKLLQFDSVVQNCTSVLEKDTANVKALYRRGQALVSLNNLDDAKKDFLRAKEIEPNNSAVDKQLWELEVKVRAHNAKYREAFKGMFSTDSQQ